MPEEREKNHNVLVEKIIALHVIYILQCTNAPLRLYSAKYPNFELYKLLLSDRILHRISLHVFSQPHSQVMFSGTGNEAIPKPETLTLALTDRQLKNERSDRNKK